jgi:aerobic carbon-monoxide dehydrogenase medium subunit
MIIEYHRPSRIEIALELLSRKTPPTYPLAGGTLLTKKNNEDFAVVDIQDLMLKSIRVEGDQVVIGAAATLQEIADSSLLPTGISLAAHQETSYNWRQMVTIGGVIAAGNGTSVLLTVLLAAGAKISLAGENPPQPLAGILEDRKVNLAKKLITAVIIPVDMKIEYEKVAKSPADKLQVMICAALLKNELRLAIGGLGEIPILAYAGPNTDASLQAVDLICMGQSEYIRSTASVLASRCLSRLSK